MFRRRRPSFLQSRQISSILRDLPSFLLFPPPSFFRIGAITLLGRGGGERNHVLMHAFLFPGDDTFRSLSSAAAAVFIMTGDYTRKFVKEEGEEGEALLNA